MLLFCSLSAKADIRRLRPTAQEFIPTLPASMINLDPNPQDWRRLLSAAERAAMLADIARVSLAAGTELFPEQPWSDISVAADSAVGARSPIEQLGFIEHLLLVLASALAQIERSPLCGDAGTTRPVLPVRARRVTASAWMAHARLSPARRTVDEAVAVLSYDTPENRAVKSLVEVLAQDCKAIARLAEAEEEAEASARAMDCTRRLRGLLGADWWENVTSRRGDWRLPPTSRELARADYARLARARTDYRKGFGFDWENPLLTLPPREFWRLYETWCLLTVLHALQELGWRVMSTQDTFAVRAGRLTLTLAVGEKSRLDLRSASGRPLSLTYNQAYAEGRESLTHTMQPDITISDGARVWILDAKFKPYNEPGEEGGDINQMHAYRDAIVGRDGRQNVAAAWCLYAGLTGTENRAQITYGRGADTPVGALCLRPGDGATQANLRRLLAQWLSPNSEEKVRLLFLKT